MGIKKKKLSKDEEKNLTSSLPKKDNSSISNFSYERDLEMLFNLKELEIEKFFLTNPQTLALWQDRQSFVTRPWAIEGDKNNPLILYFKKFFSERVNFSRLAKLIQKSVLYGFIAFSFSWEKTKEGYWIINKVKEMDKRSIRSHERKIYPLLGDNPFSEMEALGVFYHPLEEDYPFGLLRSMAKTLLAFEAGEEDWEAAQKRFNGAVLVGYLGENHNSKSAKEMFLKGAKGLALGGGVSIVLNEKDKLDLIEPTAKSNISTSFAIRQKFLVDTFSKLILGQTLTTDSGANASYAIGEVHANTKEQIAIGDMERVASFINKIIRLVIDVNFSNVKEYPIFSYLKQRVVNKEVAERDKILKELGVHFSKDYIEEMYGIQQKYFTLTED